MYYTSVHVCVEFISFIYMMVHTPLFSTPQKSKNVLTNYIWTYDTHRDVEFKL